MTMTDEINKRIKKLEEENSALKKRLLQQTGMEADPGSYSGDDPDISFYDLFNIDEIQAIQDSFSKAVGISSLITAPDGTPITRPSNFCRLCRDIIRSTEKGLANCKKSDCIIGAYRPDGPTVQPCLSSGLYDAGASIRAGNKHIANWLMGQIRTEVQNENSLASYALDIGADPSAYKEALAEVPVMSLEQFTGIANALYLFANLLSDLALQNLKQKKDIYRLSGMLPICASCKKIRDDKGYWNRIETYIEKHSGAVFSHGICPDCLEKLYGTESWYAEIKNQKENG